MWRFLSSITRGARSVRPSQCCSQDNVDESGNSFLQVPRTPQPLQCQDIVQAQHSLKDGCDLIKLSKCIYSQLAKWGSQNSDSSPIHPKFHWVWVFPCNVHPSIEDGRNEWERRKWERFYRRRQQILLSNTMLNAVGWGSAAAFTWSLCQYLRTYSLLYHNNSKQNSNVICDSECRTAFAESSENSDVVKTDSQNISDEDITVSSLCNYQVKCDLHHFNSFSFHQSNWAFNTAYKGINGWENISSMKINGSILCQPVLDTGQVHHNTEHKANKPNKEERQTLCPEEVISQEIYVDTEPQIENDRHFLERVKTDDSGFLESSECDRNSTQNIKDEFISDTQAANAGNFDLSTKQIDVSTDQIDVTLLTDGLDYLEDDSVGEPGHSISATDNLLSSHISSVGIEAPKRIVPEVIIEDCSDDDNDVVDRCTSFSKTVKQQNLPPRQSANSFGIDEFSDGLKEIIEAGRKDLNDFSTAFMGILEGDIGRMVAEEKPELAIPYFRAGALLGDVASTFNLALCYHTAQGVEQDLKKARELYEAAHLAGHSWATYNLAVMISQGEGGPTNPQQAYRLLLQAAQKGVKEAEAAIQQIKQPLRESSHSDSIALHDLQDDRSLASAKSEPSLSSVVSHIWSSSYSTTDLDFMEESEDELYSNFSALNTNSTGKPAFYIGSP